MGGWGVEALVRCMQLPIIDTEDGLPNTRGRPSLVQARIAWFMYYLIITHQSACLSRDSELAYLLRSLIKLSPPPLFFSHAFTLDVQ